MNIFNRYATALLLSGLVLDPTSALAEKVPKDDMIKIMQYTDDHTSKRRTIGSEDDIFSGFYEGGHIYGFSDTLRSPEGEDVVRNVLMTRGYNFDSVLILQRENPDSTVFFYDMAFDGQCDGMVVMPGRPGLTEDDVVRKYVLLSGSVSLNEDAISGKTPSRVENGRIVEGNWTYSPELTVPLLNKKVYLRQGFPRNVGPTEDGKPFIFTPVAPSDKDHVVLYDYGKGSITDVETNREFMDKEFHREVDYFLSKWRLEHPK